MKWALRKNAPPATAADLQAEADVALAAIAADEQELHDIDAALPSLVQDPAARADAEVEREKIEVRLRRNKRALKLIQDAIPAAEHREESARIQSQIDERNRKSAKLRRNLKARYVAAAHEFAQVLRDMAEDESERRRLYMIGGPFRLDAGDTAEGALRREFSCAHNGLTSLTEDVMIRDWSGRVIFRG